MFHCNFEIKDGKNSFCMSTIVNFWRNYIYFVEWGWMKIHLDALLLNLFINDSESKKIYSTFCIYYLLGLTSKVIARSEKLPLNIAPAKVNKKKLGEENVFTSCSMIHAIPPQEPKSSSQEENHNECRLWQGSFCYVRGKDNPDTAYNILEPPGTMHTAYSPTNRYMFNVYVWIQLIRYAVQGSSSSQALEQSLDFDKAKSFKSWENQQPEHKLYQNFIRTKIVKTKRIWK